ncbi:uncharacterized protein LOC110747220 isoform X3 [Prunus avium]|uniref:Uncharacterized protein LOC110747220 isoform X3 n=1 Tax=Prunus avium TaxID=42229 RepID=A0A6P5RDX7_PRUAV|nr:uncharacterized protein LOC110747220 isoform X3 [Prunus avium]XP_021803116.1 uncharacterized protein LOC110747220 isoform X3 [Prunus avium]
MFLLLRFFLWAFCLSFRNFSRGTSKGFCCHLLVQDKEIEIKEVGYGSNQSRGATRSATPLRRCSLSKVPERSLISLSSSQQWKKKTPATDIVPQMI